MLLIRIAIRRQAPCLCAIDDERDDTRTRTRARRRRIVGWNGHRSMRYG